MFADARDVPDGTELAADVCIVGAGAAGITIARELLPRGRRVVLLESGFDAFDPVTQTLYDGVLRGLAYFPLGDEGTRTRQFGGSTNRWNGECRPLAAIDFETRAWMKDSGWPFDLAAPAPALRPCADRVRARGRLCMPRRTGGSTAGSNRR